MMRFSRRLWALRSKKAEIWQQTQTSNELP